MVDVGARTDEAVIAVIHIQVRQNDHMFFHVWQQLTQKLCPLCFFRGAGLVELGVELLGFLSFGTELRGVVCVVPETCFPFSRSVINVLLL